MKKVCSLLGLLILNTSLAKEGLTKVPSIIAAPDGLGTAIGSPTAKPAQGSSNASTPTKLNLNSVSYLKGQCSFEPSLGEEDEALLENAKNTLSALKSSTQCKPLENQISAFETAMTQYSSYNAADRELGQEGNLDVNCNNFERLFNEEFEFFINNNASVSEGDYYDNCSEMESRSETIECATKINAEKQVRKKHECETFKTSLADRGRSETIRDSYRLGLEAMRSVINNEGCLDSSGDQRLSFIQAAVNLTGRAAALNNGASGGLLIGAATDLLSSLVTNIFKSNNRDNLTILENRQNFTKLACLYETVERKARRCDRVFANRTVGDTESAYRESINCLSTDLKPVVQADGFLEQLNDIIVKVQSTRAPASGGQSVPGAEQSRREQAEFDFDALAQNLSMPFPGSNDDSSLLDIGVQAAADIIVQLTDIVADETKLKDYFRRVQSLSESPEQPTSPNLRLFQRQLNEEIKKANQVSSLLAAIQNANNQGVGLTEAHLDVVRQKMSSFGENGVMNFNSAFNEMLKFKATLSEDNLSEMIINYNAQVDIMNDHKAVVSSYNQSKQVASTEFNDDGNFNEVRKAIHPYLSKMLNGELDILEERARRQLVGVPVGRPPREIRELMQKEEEELIYPMLRACNQLRSVMNEGRRFDTTDQHSVCNAFNCEKGLKTFPDFLKSENTNVTDPEVCRSATCRGQYDRFICSETTSLRSLRSKFKNELLEKGTICGKSVNEAFKR